jgi:methyl-accepting chemotaxis protein
VPINRVTKLMERLAQGDHRAEVADIERRDEIGTMARAVEVFKHGLIEADRLRAEQKAAEARASAERRAGMHKLADGFELSVKGMVEAVSSAGVEMRASAEAMTGVA